MLGKAWCFPSHVPYSIQMSRLLVFSISRRHWQCPLPCLVYVRTYAMSSETSRKLLERQFERGLGKEESGAPNSVGPFPLGVRSSNLRSSREPPKSWNQLTTGGKGMVLCIRALYMANLLFPLVASAPNNSTSIEPYSHSFRSHLIGGAGLRPRYRTICKEFPYSPVR
jgi:hypothetical protein